MIRRLEASSLKLIQLSARSNPLRHSLSKIAYRLTRKNSLRKITRERKEQVSDFEKRYGCWPDSIKEIAKQADSSNNTNIYTKRWESFFKFLSTYQHTSGMKSADFLRQKGDQTILSSFRDDRSLPVFEIGISYSNTLMLDLNTMLNLTYRKALEPFGTEVMDIPILD